MKWFHPVLIFSLTIAIAAEAFAQFGGGGGAMHRGGSALVQIESRIDIVRNRLTAMEDVSDAAKRLYAGLTAEQRAIADGLLPGTVPTLYTGNMSAAAPGRGRPPERQRPRE